MIEELIDKSLQKEQDDKKGRKRSGKWSPSSFGKCYRSQYWNRKNEPKTNPPDARALRVFKVGHMFHEFVQGYIPDQMVENKVDNNDDIFGYADIVTKDSVIDLKSQHSRAFWYMTKKGADIAKDKYSNWLQVACYAMILGKEWCKLCFISKDDLSIKEYAMKTEKWTKEVDKEVNILRSIWEVCNKTGDIPAAKPRAYNGKECAYCNFKDKCKEVESGKNQGSDT